MRYFKKLQCFLVALSLILTLMPYAVKADDTSQYYIIRAWRDLADWKHENVVESVKVRIAGSGSEWQEISQDGSGDGFPVPPSSTLDVDVKFQDGYRLVNYGSGSLFLSTTAYSFNTIVYSKSKTQITLPSTEPDETNKNLGLLFGSAREGEKIIENVTLNISAPKCGTHVENPKSPAPTVSVPSGKGYKIVEDSAQWVLEDADQGADEGFDIVGGNKYLFEVTLSYDATTGYHFTHPFTPNIKVNGGELVDQRYTYNNLSGEASGVNLQILVEVTAEHVSSVPEKLNVVPPTCTKSGSHDEKVICTVCGEQVSYKSVVDKAIGHNWGEWEVIKEATVSEEGEKQRICKNDSSHIQTEAIPCVKLYTVTFDVQGHGTAPEPQKVEAGKTATKPQNMSAPGYVFGGWYTDSECTKAFDFESPITEDITLYANWIPSTYLGTGDNSSIVLWFTLFGLSLTAIAFMEIRKKYLVANNKIK